MSIKPRTWRREAGMTLPEALIALAITGVLLVALVNFSMFSARSFSALFNYVELNDDNRLAIDHITADVREANRVIYYSTNSLTLEDSNGWPIVYSYSPNTRTLTRSQNGVIKVVLHDCDSLNFTIGQRNTVGGTYDVYPAATPLTCKVVNVSWVCSRTILGSRQNSESVQTARIVIRRQGT
jgi:type II secretory pathway pseudopilin PulG